MRLTGSGWRALVYLVAAISLPACTGETLGPGGGQTGAGGSGAFTPAVQPPDVCALLPPGDVATVLPTAALGVAQPTSMSSEGWGLECDWKDTDPASAKAVTLVVVGVVTSAGIADLDNGLQSVAYGGAPSMPVSGLGDAAEYENSTNFQILEARAGSYLIEVDVRFATPAVSEPQLHPLVAEVLGQL